MSQGFYEMLGVSRDATPEAIRSAFQGRLAALVRRLKAARKQGADVTLLDCEKEGDHFCQSNCESAEVSAEGRFQGGSSS